MDKLIDIDKRAGAYNAERRRKDREELMYRFSHQSEMRRAAIDELAELL